MQKEKKKKNIGLRIFVGIIAFVVLYVAGALISQHFTLEFAKGIAQPVINFVIARDEEGLFSTLSPKLKKYAPVKQKIREAFEFIDGEIISYELPKKGIFGGGKAFENGRKTHEDIVINVRDIKTDTGKTYEITIQYFSVFEEDVEVVGIAGIYFYLLDEDNYTIEKVIIRDESIIKA